MKTSEVSVVVTGIDWMGGGIGSIESAMEEIFQKARNEILLTVYSISIRTDLLFELLDVALSRGVQAKMIINSFEKQPTGVIQRLEDLAGKYPHFHLYGFSGGNQSDLHAKVIVADRKTALVGSSNLSWRGMVTNYELATLVHEDAAIKVGQLVDRLIASENVAKIYVP